MRERGQYSAVDALAEMRGEIQAFNETFNRRPRASLLRPGSNPRTNARLERHLEKAREQDRERRQQRDLERSRRMVADYRRNHPAPPGVRGGPGRASEPRMGTRFGGAASSQDSGPMKPLPPMSPQADPGSRSVVDVDAAYTHPRDSKGLHEKHGHPLRQMPGAGPVQTVAQPRPPRQSRKPKLGRRSG